MRTRPSKIAEAIVVFFLPPACREEVLGDLYERYVSPLQYALLAILTVPCVVASRIRRTADPQVLLMQVFALYGSFLIAALLKAPALLHEESGLLRLGIPVGILMLGVVLEDAYGSPTMQPRRHLLLTMFTVASVEVSVQFLASRVLLLGFLMGLLFLLGIRRLFPPAVDQLQGVHAPAAWLKRVPDITGIRWLATATAILVAIWIAAQIWK